MCVRECVRRRTKTATENVRMDTGLFVPEMKALIVAIFWGIKANGQNWT